jgi:hypothetical protein
MMASGGRRAMTGYTAQYYDLSSGCAMIELASFTWPLMY